MTSEKLAFLDRTALELLKHRKELAVLAARHYENEIKMYPMGPPTKDRQEAIRAAQDPAYASLLAYREAEQIWLGRQQFLKKAAE